MEIIDFVIKALEKEALRARKFSHKVDGALCMTGLYSERLELYRQFDAIAASDKKSSDKVVEFEAITKKIQEIDKLIEKNRRTYSYKNIVKGCDCTVWAMTLEEEISRLKWLKSNGRTGLR